MNLTEHVAREVRRFQSILERNLAIAQDRAAEIQADAYRGQVVESESVASREFLDSIGTRVTMSAEGHRIAEAFSDVAQASVMEHGRRPGAPMPPVDAILEWLPYRGIEQKRSIAFAIAMKIARDGIEPRHIAEHAFNQTRFQVTGEFNLAVAKSVAEFNKI